MGAHRPDWRGFGAHSRSSVTLLHDEPRCESLPAHATGRHRCRNRCKTAAKTMARDGSGSHMLDARRASQPRPGVDDSRRVARYLPVLPCDVIWKSVPLHPRLLDSLGTCSTDLQTPNGGWQACSATILLSCLTRLSLPPRLSATWSRSNTFRAFSIECPPDRRSPPFIRRLTRTPQSSFHTWHSVSQTDDIPSVDHQGPACPRRSEGNCPGGFLRKRPGPC